MCEYLYIRIDIMEISEKNVNDEFMLKEYESIAAAHFDSQDGLRQQFRFYLLIAAVPLTVLGLVLREPSQAIPVRQIGLLDLPPFLGLVFLGIGLLGTLMLLSMINTALDATLYARTVNGIRNYFANRAETLGADLAPYLKMPRNMDQPKYFHIRAFFWQVVMLGFINAGYVAFGALTIWRQYISVCCALSGCTLWVLWQVGAYLLFSYRRQQKEIST